MKHLTLTALLAVFLAVPAAHAGESPDGAWVVRLEAPFVKELPAWMPLRIDLEIAGGKPVQAMASAMHLNLNWHSVDVSGLRLTDGRLTGSLAVSFQSDDHVKADIVASANAPNPVDRAKDPYAELPAQVLAVDIPLGTITGAAPGTATIEKDVVNKGQKQLTVAARAWRPVPAAAGAPRYVEFQIERWHTFNLRRLPTCAGSTVTPMMLSRRAPCCCAVPFFPMAALATGSACKGPHATYCRMRICCGVSRTPKSP